MEKQFSKLKGSDENLEHCKYLIDLEAKAIGLDRSDINDTPVGKTIISRTLQQVLMVNPNELQEYLVAQVDSIKQMPANNYSPFTSTFSSEEIVKAIEGKAKILSVGFIGAWEKAFGTELQYRINSYNKKEINPLGSSLTGTITHLSGEKEVEATIPQYDDTTNRTLKKKKKKKINKDNDEAADTDDLESPADHNIGNIDNNGNMESTTTIISKDNNNANQLKNYQSNSIG
ncbi:hypothetical protein ACTA71_006060 [Dictyostelium dimigraforme]